MPETAEERTARLDDIDRRLDDFRRRGRNLRRRADRAIARRDEGRPYPEERLQKLRRELAELAAEADGIVDEVRSG